MPRQKKSSAKKKQHASASAASPKRLKTGPRMPSPLETPYVSLLTGLDYCFDAAKEETHATIQCVPTSLTAALPGHAGFFLQKAATAFSTAVHDVLLGPDDLLINLTLDTEKVTTYYQFCQRSPITIPDSDFAFKATPQALDDLLERYINFEVLDSYMAEVGVQREFGDSSEYSMSESSDTDSSVEPAPTRTKGRLPLLGLRHTAPSSTPTSAPVSANSATASPKQADPVTELPVMDTAETTVATPEVLPETTPISQQSTSQDPLPATGEPAEPAPTAPAGRSRPRSRFVPVDFSLLKVEVPPPPPVLTVLFRPTTQGQSFKDVNPAKLMKELLLYGDWTDQRQIRDGGIAVDFPPSTPLEPILAISQLVDLPTKASLPATAASIAGVISGVHWELTDEEILEAVQTVPETKVVAVKRLAKPGQRSWVVKLSFEGATMPTHAILFRRRHPVKPYQSSPLICYKCSRFGHTARVCRSERRCMQCSEDHDSRECPNQAKPTCSNCQGAHPANSRACPTWGFQKKVCEVRAEYQTTFKTARKAVGLAARNYASAVKGTTAPPQPATTSRNQPKPAPTQPTRTTATNTVNPKPLPPPASAATLATIFTQLIKILQAAAATNNFADAITQVTCLFQDHAPDLAATTTASP